MKYLCLVYYDENITNAMNPAEWLALNKECLAYGDALRQSGHFLGGNALQPTTASVTLRMRNDQAQVTDGPFAETKEQLAGFYLLEAKNLDEALSLASKIPPAKFGSIEVRPVRDLPQDQAPARR